MSIQNMEAYEWPQTPKEESTLGSAQPLERAAGVGQGQVTCLVLREAGGF
jgi:hypothetical protein